MNEVELEILHNLNIIVVQGWIIIVLLAGCIIALFMKE